MGPNFARNWLVPLSGCLSGTYMHSLASNNDKDPYEMKCHIRAQCAPPPWVEEQLSPLPHDKCVGVTLLLHSHSIQPKFPHLKFQFPILYHLSSFIRPTHQISSSYLFYIVYRTFVICFMNLKYIPFCLKYLNCIHSRILQYNILD